MVKLDGSSPVRRTRKLAKWTLFLILASIALLWHMNRGQDNKWLPWGASPLNSDDFNWSQVNRWLLPHFIKLISKDQPLRAAGI
jgi:hypothetical protein